MKLFHQFQIILPRIIADLVKDEVVAAVLVEVIIVVDLDQSKVSDLGNHVNVSFYFSYFEYTYFILYL